MAKIIIDFTLENQRDTNDSSVGFGESVMSISLEDVPMENAGEYVSFTLLNALISASEKFVKEHSCSADDGVNMCKPQSFMNAVNIKLTAMRDELFKDLNV